MSKKKEGIAAVTAKDLACAHERVRLAEQVFEQTKAQAEKVMQDVGMKLQAARNDLDGLAERAKKEAE